jgi:hypothetical protein
MECLSAITGIPSMAGDNSKEPFWTPLRRPFRTAIVLAGHIALAGVLVTAIWGSRTLHDVT